MDVLAFIAMIIVPLAAAVYLIETALRIINYFPDKKGSGASIEKKLCKNCGKEIDIDYPKCPYCKHPNE